MDFFLLFLFLERFSYVGGLNLPIGQDREPPEMLSPIVNRQGGQDLKEIITPKNT